MGDNVLLLTVIPHNYYPQEGERKRTRDRERESETNKWHRGIVELVSTIIACITI